MYTNIAVICDQVDNVCATSSHARKGEYGTLYLTATHLIFVDKARTNELWIVHSHIQSIEKLSLTQNGSPLKLRYLIFHSYNCDLILHFSCCYDAFLDSFSSVPIHRIYIGP